MAPTPAVQTSARRASRQGWRARRDRASAAVSAPRSAGPPQRAAAKPAAGASKPSPSAAAAQAPLALVINLERRADRLVALRKLRWELEWERLDAVDGRTLSWGRLGQLVHRDAIEEARWAEKNALPTICRSTGSFSPHLTLAAVGCGLSHRKSWERLVADGRDHALIMEDDLSAVAPDFRRKMASALAQLPPSWLICYLGYHESTGRLLAANAAPNVVEVPRQAAITGLFGYVLRRSAAALLLKHAWPLRHQVDVAIGGYPWPAGSRFVVNPNAVLLASPKSEEGSCDTDVQTLGAPTARAHSAIPPSFLRL